MTRMTVTPEKREAIMRSVDWERVRAVTEAEVEHDLATDPDAAAPLTEAEGRGLRVQVIRKRLGLSQLAFAQRFHIPVGTLRDWEQGRVRPDNAAWAYLRVIDREPAAVVRALEVDGG